MGIYIPGIEKPKGHNYVTITIWPSGAASYVLFDREGILRDFKDFKDIKVIPVPEHGRLIDADAAVANRDDCMNWCYDLHDLPDYLSDCPTIIPASEEGE